MWSRSLVVRTGGDPASAVASIRRTLRAADPWLSVGSVDTMDALVRRTFAEERYRAAIVTLFGVLSVVVAAVGMYGVTARAVAGRTRETGIRLALGATAPSVARGLVAFTLAGVVAGVALGLAGAVVAARALAPLLFDVRPSDPSTFVGVVLLLGAVSLAATWLPARRAGRIEVMQVLRGE